MEWIGLLVLGIPAVLLGLPAICDVWAWLQGLASRGPGQGPSRRRQTRDPAPPLLFLIPAHDEEDLITRCVTSLHAQAYPPDQMSVVVVADHCRDATADLARRAGADVLVRDGRRERGKHHAIAWALDRLTLEDWSAVVLIDADTVVDPDYATHLASRAPLERRLIQTYVDMSNEFENWLTRMAGLLTRNRWDIALRLKDAADLNCPLTGDGTVLGTEVLREHGWNVETITEGWELYGRYTLEGLSTTYESRARLHAQETRSLAQSETQRQRWTAGRLSVLARYGWKIMTDTELRLLQQLDLIAELGSPGPVMRGFLGVIGICAVGVLDPLLAPALTALFATTVLQPAVYSLLSLWRHPEPVATLTAFTRFPLYAAWRIPVGVKAMLASGTDRWVRTVRHEEPSSSPESVREIESVS